MKRPLRQYAGELMIFNSIMHTIIGILQFAGVVSGMVADGLFLTVHTTTEREEAWWFFVLGLLYLTTGLLLRSIQRRGLPAPASVAWILIGLGAAGLVCAPSFGWPFIAAVGILVLASNRTVADRESDPAVT